MITEKICERYNGRDVHLYELSDGGLKVGVTDFGGIIRYIKLDTPQGEKDLCLRFDSVEEYLAADCYCGATVGRVANRIAGAKYTLNGKTYRVSANVGETCLHGGENAFDKRFFRAETEGDALVLSLFSADGDNGFNGNMHFSVRFEVRGGALSILFTAESDEDTLWNPTNHAYFNFGDVGNILDTELTLYADFYTPASALLIPTGKILPVAGTPFDFTSPKTIGKDVFVDDEQLKLAGGYDHNFVLRSDHVATARRGGVVMDIYTDMPGVQFYSGNMLSAKGRRAYGKYDGFCLEPQFFPNAVNTENFRTPLLKAGEKQSRSIRYEFRNE